MLGFIGQTVEGGWNAVANIVGGIGKGASSLVSGFFPTPQYEKVKSESVAPAGGAGTTYRQTRWENPSMALSWNFAQKDWLGSPQEANLAVPAKIKASQDLAAKVSAEPQWGPIETFVDIMKYGTEQVGAIRTVADEFMYAMGLKKREPISDTKKTKENPDGLMQNLQDIRDKAADVLPTLKAVGSAILDQVKGLFNLGYESTGGQPVFSIQHELEPKTKITIGMAAAGIIIAMLLLGRKK